MRFLDGKEKRIRTRRLTGGLLSLCMVAVMVLVVGTGLTSQRAVEQAAAPEDPQIEAVDASAENAISDIESQPAEEGALMIESDPLYGDFEKATALILVDESTDRAALATAVASCDFIETKDISNQSGAAGYVKVSVDSDLSMSEVMAAFEDAGIDAQPNYVYTTLEDESDEAAELVKSLAAAPINELDVIGAIAGEEDAEAQATIENLQAVAEQAASDEFAAAAIEAAAEFKPDDARLADQWGLDSVDVYKAWGISKSAEDGGAAKVTVAVLDSGMNSHEDLNANVIACYNSAAAVSTPSEPDPGEIEHPDDGDQTGQAEVETQAIEDDLANVTDVNGHGTHVAGIVSARANNGVGVAGSSYNANLVIIKGTTSDVAGQTNKFTTTSIAEGYRWLIQEKQSSLSGANVRVINLSLGGNATTAPLRYDRDMEMNITAAKEAGILTVCAAGNGATSGAYPAIPGDHPDCLTVINLFEGAGTANDSSGNHEVARWSGSNYNVDDGSHLKNISAPGTYILSTLNSGDYGEKTGTSMSAPLVSGVAALLFAYNSGLTPDQVRAVIEQTATDLGDEGWDVQTGYGEIDAYHALQALSADVTTETVKKGEEADLEIKCADDSTLNASEWTWTSDDSSVVAVDSDTGKITGGNAGTTTIRGTYKAPCTAGSSATVLSITQEITTTEDDTPVETDVDISGADITSNSKEYDGNPVDLASTIVVTVNGTTLTQGVHYTITVDSGSDLTNVGTHYFTITAVPGSGYTGARPGTFSITQPGTPVVTDIDISGAVVTSNSKDFDGNPVDLANTVVVTVNGTTLTQGTHYTISANPGADTTNPGQFGFTVEAISGSGYTGTYSGTFTINQVVTDIDISGATISQNSKQYDGASVDLASTVAVTVNGTQLVYGRDYTITPDTGADLTSAGSFGFTVTAVSGSGYTGTCRGTFTIIQVVTGNDLSQATILNNSREFNGYPVDPASEIIVMMGATKLDLDRDYTVSYNSGDDRTNAGSFNFTILPAPGSAYSGSKQGTFTIDQKNIATAKLVLQPIVYKADGNYSLIMNDEMSSISYSLNGPGTDRPDFTITGFENCDKPRLEGANGPVAHIQGTGNYYGTRDVTFGIKAAARYRTQFKAELVKDSYVYTGGIITPEVRVTYNGILLEPGVDYTVSKSNNNINVTSNASVDVKGAGAFARDYSENQTAFSDTVNFSILPKSLADADVSITPSLDLFYYDGTPQEIESFNASYNKMPLQVGRELNVSYENNVNVGTATAVITSRVANYTGERRVPFTIESSPTSITIDNLDDLYYNLGNECRHNNLVIKEYDKVLTEGVDYSLRYVNNREVGEAYVYVDGLGNYQGQQWRRSFHILAVSGPSGNQGANQGTPGSQGGNNQGGTTNPGGQSTPNAQTPAAAPAVTGKWVKQGGRWWYAYDGSTSAVHGKSYPANEWVSIGGKLYHFDSAGWMHANWVYLDGAWYWHGSDGAMKTGWVKTGGKWYYLGADGKMLTGKQNIGGATYILNTSSGAMHTGWCWYDNAWHWCNSSGAVVTGWVKTGGKWYYLGGDGKMLTGKQNIGGKTYFLDTSSGAMRTGWVAYDNCWYWCDSSGAMKTGWLFTGGKWYYLDQSTGIMQQYWQNIDGKTYFFDTPGNMLTGWVTIDGSTYFFSSSGDMVTNAWIANKWYVDVTGKWVDTK